MGEVVLSTTQAEPAEMSFITELRGYAHCTPPTDGTTGAAAVAGSVTFAYLNVHHNETFSVKMAGSNPDGTRGQGGDGVGGR